MGAQGLRVVMVAPTPFFSDRGCHVRILEEARALSHLGAEITVCTYFLGDDPPGLDVRRAARLPGYKKRSAGPSWGKLLLDASLLRLVRRVVREKNPHVLHAHLHEGMAIAGRIRDHVPRVLDVQGGLTDETLDHGFLPDVPPVRRLLEGMEGRIARSAGVVVTSHEDAGRVLTERFGVPADRVRVVGDAGDLPAPSEARVRALRETWGLSAKEPVVIYAGLLGEHQGTPHLLALAKALREGGDPGKLLVMGYPEASWRRDAEARGLGDRVIWGGRFSYSDLASVLALGWVAVSPKTSLTEGNQKLCVYLQAGLPVVAFDTPASREIVGDGGVLVSSGEAFCRETLSILGNAGRRSEAAARARERARGMRAWKDVSEGILDAYRLAGARWP